MDKQQTLQELQALLKSPGWGLLANIAKERANNYLQELLTPAGQDRTNFLRGSMYELSVLLQIPEMEIQRLEQELRDE